MTCFSKICGFEQFNPFSSAYCSSRVASELHYYSFMYIIANYITRTYVRIFQFPRHITQCSMHKIFTRFAIKAEFHACSFIYSVSKGRRFVIYMKIRNYAKYYERTIREPTLHPCALHNLVFLFMKKGVRLSLRCARAIDGTCQKYLSARRGRSALWKQELARL